MKKIINKQWLLCMLLLATVLTSCSDYLDVVPDGVSRLENAFSMREQAIKYLYTCYSYMPKDGNAESDPGILGGDELWTLGERQNPLFGYNSFDIARGYQNATNPLVDQWDHFYRALRDCNIFLENVGTVPDLEPWERDQWIGEVMFLKAYYHFYLFRMYGPIPMIRENLPITASPEKVRVSREPVDSCVNYMVSLLDNAQALLPLTNISTDELGHITKPIALSLKAKILVTAASPLFNGNTDQATLKNLDGTQLFNQTKMNSKWDLAVEACRTAVQVCEQAGFQLYKYPGSTMFSLTDTIKTQLSLRNAFCEKWNNEVIWANTQSICHNMQIFSTPKMDIKYIDAFDYRSILGAPLKIAEMFYSDKGVPITEDKTWNLEKKYDARLANSDENLYVRQGVGTIELHFNREPRFYAWVGFDAGIWYGQGHFDDSKVSELFYVACKKGQVSGIALGQGPITGYYPKKYIHYQNVQSSLTSYSVNDYPWPIIRLSDLYLLYAEALNEAADNDQSKTEALKYVDKIRARAGLLSVKDSWSTYSNNPGKYTTQRGLQQIIQQERMIELSFEGQRFWDIRRWKTAIDLYKQPIEGWDFNQNIPSYFYRTTIVARQTFGIKDYFWPIRNNNIVVNRNLVQNIGW